MQKLVYALGALVAAAALTTLLAGAQSGASGSSSSTATGTSAKPSPNTTTPAGGGGCKYTRGDVSPGDGQGGEGDTQYPTPGTSVHNGGTEPGDGICQWKFCPGNTHPPGQHGPHLDVYAKNIGSNCQVKIGSAGLDVTLHDEKIYAVVSGPHNKVKLHNTADEACITMQENTSVLEVGNAKGVCVHGGNPPPNPGH